MVTETMQDKIARLVLAGDPQEEIMRLRIALDRLAYFPPLKRGKKRGHQADRAYVRWEDIEFARAILEDGK